MHFTDFIQTHRRSILFLIVVLSLAGLASSINLPVSLFPKINFPRIQVNLDSGDQPVERMAIQVTRPVEEAVRAVQGVRNVRSTTSRGSAEISINFDWGRDMSISMLQVESALNQVRNLLPPGTSFLVRRMNPTVFPILGYSLTSETRSRVNLRDIALYKIRPFLTRLPGVARIGVLGGAPEEYHVVVDQAKVSAFGLNLNDITKALSSANVVSAVGRIEDNNRLYLILSDTQFDNFKEIGNTILGSGINGLILLEDVATVSRSHTPQWTRVTADGNDAVLFQVYQQFDGNTVDIARQITEKFPELRKLLPNDVHISNWYDQSELIVSSGKSVSHAVLFGVFMASLVILIFLKNFKITLIALVTVPIVLATTTLLLFVMGMSFNIMTLGGMAAAVGLIIDDMIVVIEHILRRLQDGHGNKHERVMQAVAEITQPLAGSSASTIIIFLPLAFLSGVTGAFFKALSVTMAASLVISFLVAWLAVPLLSLFLLKQKDIEHKPSNLPEKSKYPFYSWIMHIILPHPWLVLSIIIPFLALGWLGFNQVGTGFLPRIDEGGFILDYRAKAGTSLAETDRLLRQVEVILQETPEVQTYSRRTGLRLSGGLTEANNGDFFVRLKGYPRRGIDSVVDDVRQQIEHSVPGLDIEMALLMEDLIGDLTAVPQPIEIKLFSDDSQTLNDLAVKTAQAIEKITGVVDVNNGIVIAGDALIVKVDREKVALEGVSPGEITVMLKNQLTGSIASQVERSPKMINLRVRIPKSGRDRISNLGALRLRAPDGHWFPLGRVAELRVVTGQPQIMRDDLKRMIAVTGRISGRDMGSTIADIVAVLEHPDFLTQGVYYQLGGLYQQQRIAFRGLIWVLILAVMLIFALLLFLYESFRVAIAMLSTTLLTTAAVFVGLWLTGTELNITAMMGMTMVIGIATEVAIFYYSEYKELGENNNIQDRLIAAGENRLRPITMTTLAAILALLPLALGIGPGAAMQQPLAIAIISGLAVQLPFVLTIFPALYMLMHQRNVSH